MRLLLLNTYCAIYRAGCCIPTRLIAQYDQKWPAIIGSCKLKSLPSNHGVRKRQVPIVILRPQVILGILTINSRDLVRRETEIGRTALGLICRKRSLMRERPLVAIEEDVSSLLLHLTTSYRRVYWRKIQNSTPTALPRSWHGITEDNFSWTSSSTTMQT